MTKKKITNAQIIDTLKLTDKELDKNVRIQGTRYDRKRKYFSEDFVEANKMLKKGKSFSEISKATGIRYSTLRYNLDTEYRDMYNAIRDGKHTGKDKISKKNRIEYKRGLVANGLISA